MSDDYGDSERWAAEQYDNGVAEGAAAERARTLALLDGYLIEDFNSLADDHAHGWNDAVLSISAAVRSASSSAPVEGEKPQPLCCCNPRPLSPDSWCKAKDHSAALAAPTQGEKQP